MTARVALHVGDALAVLRTLEASSADALVTDPPSGIGFMGADWDKDKGGRDAWIAWLAEVLVEARRVLRPGAQALVWALPRTAHWTATAVEDAGFKIVDVVVHLQAQGFPKSKSLLKPAAEHWILARAPGLVLELGIDACRLGPRDRESYGLATAARSQGVAYGAPSPSADFDASKGRWPANAVFSHADGCESLGEKRVRRTSHAPASGASFAGGSGGVADFGAGGRSRAASVVHADADGLETIEAWRCVDGCPVAELDAQSGDRPSGRAVLRNGGGNRIFNGGRGIVGAADAGYTDSGGASRFFFCSKASTADRSEGLDARNPHPTVKPVELMRWLCRLVTPPGGTVLDPFAGSGTTGVAAMHEQLRFVGIERDEAYAAIARRRIEHAMGPLFAAAAGGAL